MDKDIDFAHLHVHSEYSLLDGSAKINELISRTKELGMKSIAITDHGVMFGVVDFYKKAKSEGIKPIIGCEIYVSSKEMTNKENREDNFYYHLILLAENNEGYHNLMKISSLAYLDGFYYKPRIDLEHLRTYSKGIIASSACLGGPIAKSLLRVGYAKGKEMALLLNDIFGQDNFFIELQNHGLEKQLVTNPQMIQISDETGIPIICTNDVHYIYKEDEKAHDVLICIQTNKTVSDTDRMIYEGGNFYLRSPKEMSELFKDYPQSLENTVKIADRCNVDFTFNEYKLPKFNVPLGKDAFEYLNELCLIGMKNRYNEITKELQERLDYELSVIKSMGFVEYFLIVWDFIKYARDNNISVGPGRGSAAGCIVAYSLKITNIDPIKYNLIFERFLNPERISMPDIDIDFCYERRQEVIDYVIKKYGHDYVAQIITFGTMAAKGVLRDVGRALGMAYGEVDKIAKMIPFAIGMTLDKALEVNYDLKEEYETNEEVKFLIDMGKRLEGLPRHASTHAAGVVICNEPVSEYVPLYQNDGVVTTQFPMNTLEELGLLKMDFLGLRTLTVIQNAVSEINRIYNINLDIDNIPHDDKKVYEMIAQAKTEGVFQLESSGMKSFMKELIPSCLEDLIAGISLYRPGPMDFIPKYVRGKNSGQKIVYLHPSLEHILKPTYGCIVYQEQVMQIVQDLAGYSLGRSDLVRRAMSKKKADVMEEERKNFIYGIGDSVPGCIKNGIPEKIAIQIFDEMTDFAKYAFNKSHAAAYAVIGYQTAYLKYYYKTEFMAALMTSVMDNTGKVSEYIHECKLMGIEVMPPDINESFHKFSVVKEKIRFGFKAIKGVGNAGIEAILNDREKNGTYKSLTEVLNRVDNSDMNKRMIESLIKAGVFDSLGGKRLQYICIYEKILNGLANTKKKTIQGQYDLFSLSSNDLSNNKELFYEDELPQDIYEYSMKELLTLEKEVLGVYISGHPMYEFKDIIKNRTNCNSLDFVSKENNKEIPLNEINDLTDNKSSDIINLSQDDFNNLYDGKELNFAGIISAKKIIYTKKNNEPMVFLTLEDLFGIVEVVVFPSQFDKYSKQLNEGVAILVNGKASIREDEDAKIICNNIKVLTKNDDSNSSTLKSTSKLWLKVSKDIKVSYKDILTILTSSRGKTSVIIYDEKTDTRQAVSSDYDVNIENNKCILQLKQLLGEKSVVIK